MAMNVILNMSFPHNYVVELGCDLSDDFRHIFYPGAQEYGHDGLLLLITGRDEKWMGSFSGTYEGALTGVYSMPNPEKLCVVSSGMGIIVNPNNPKDYEEIKAFPIFDVIALERRREMLYMNHNNIVIYSENGFEWIAKRISWDGIKIEKIDDDIIYGEAWNAPFDKYERFCLDLSSREFTTIL